MRKTNPIRPTAGGCRAGDAQPAKSRNVQNKANFGQPVGVSRGEACETKPISAGRGG
jgi:hypothetical protein